MPPKRNNKRTVAGDMLDETISTKGAEFNSFYVDEAIEDIRADVEKRCQNIIEEAQLITRQVEVNLSRSLFRLNKKTKTMKMKDFIAQSGNLVMPKNDDAMFQTQKKAPLGKSATENMSIIGATPVAKKQQEISLETPGLRVIKKGEVIYTANGSPVISDDTMTILTAKKGNPAMRHQINVISSREINQYSPTTQAKIESNPEIKKQFDAINDQMAQLLSELPS